MVGRTRRGSIGGSKIDEELVNSERTGQDVTIMFVTKLASALQKRGQRKWKEKDVNVALDHAINALPEGDLKSSLVSSRSSATAELLRQLQTQQEQTIGTERTTGKPLRKRAKVAPASESEAPPPPAVVHAALASTAVAPPPLRAASCMLDSGLIVAMQSLATGDADPPLSSQAAMLCRFPPPRDAIACHVARLVPGLATDDANLSTLLSASEAALKVCSAISGRAGSSHAAIAVFEPLVTLLRRAHEVFQQTVATERKESKMPSTDLDALIDAHQKLEDLAARGLMCMHMAANEMRLAANAVDGAASADRASEWWLRWSDATDAKTAATDVSVDAACSVAAAVVSLRTELRFNHVLVTKLPPLDGVAALASHDMRLLAPYAATGHLRCAAREESIKIVKSGDLAAQTFIALYKAAADRSLGGGGAVCGGGDVAAYFVRIAAARVAIDVAMRAGEVRAAAALTEKTAEVVPPPEAFEWLQQQPPSGVVTEALASYKNGPSGLSKHLLEEASASSSRALAEAALVGAAYLASAGGDPASLADGGGGGKRDGEADASAGGHVTDDLLFYVSKEADAGVLGVGWDPEEGEEWGAGVGVDLEALSEEEGDEELEEKHGEEGVESGLNDSDDGDDDDDDGDDE